MRERADEVCIDAPELLTRRQQLRDTVVTGFMWVLYAYLWLPLISLVAWILGFEFAYDVMVRSGGAAQLRVVASWYLAAIALILAIFGAWSLSNRLRFSHQNRRGSFERISDQSYIAYFGISAEVLALLRHSASLALEFDAVGAIREIEDLRSGTGAGRDAQRREHKTRDYE